MKHTSKQIDQFISERMDMAASELVELIFNEFGERYTESGIRTRKCRLRKGAEESTTVPVFEGESKPKFTVEGDKVKWNYRHGVMEFSISQIDDIFYQYSKHGLNLSQVKVQNDSGMNAIQWQSFKRAFDLVKDSDVFSNYTLSLYDGQARCDMIASKISEKYNPQNMRKVIDYEDTKQRAKAYENAIKEAGKLDYRRQVFETEILEYISTNTKQVKIPISPAKSIGEAVVHVCDIHIGSNIEEVQQTNKITQKAYNEQIARESLMKVSIDANARGAQSVTLVINGDVIETFTGLNHPNSWKNIDRKYGYGVNATILACEILSDFISSVNNVSEVILVAGNHDRTTASNKEDVDGEVIQWVHYIINARFGKHMKVSFSNDVYAKKIGNVGFIFTHGHLGVSKKPSANIVLDYGFGEHIYHLVIEGHLHTRKVKDDAANRRVLVAPSIFTGNNYSKQLGFSTLAGYLFIYPQSDYPVVIDVPIS
jgi:hypothetical protein